MLALAGCALSAWVVWRKAPVVHHNRRVTPAARQHYCRISRVICGIEVLLILIGMALWPENTIIFALLLGSLAETLSIMAVRSVN